MTKTKPTIKEPTQEERDAWKRWLDARPSVVRDLGERYPPWRLYRLKTTGQRVIIVAINENGTFRIQVPANFNPTRIDVGLQVFGIKPEDLVDVGDHEKELEIITTEAELMAPRSAELRDALVSTLHSSEHVEFMRTILHERDSWILDENRQPIPASYLEWQAWRATQPGPHPAVSVQVANDAFEGEGLPYQVSTVFLPHDMSYRDGGPPILWETMVFGGTLDEEQERYSSEAAALAGHARWVARVLQLGATLKPSSSGDTDSGEQVGP